MFSTNLQTLKIHKLTQEQYERELNAGRIDSNALYLTEDKEQDLSYYATKQDLEGKSDKGHTHTIAEINELNNTLNTKSNKGHTHNISEINELNDTLNTKSDKGHTHNATEVGADSAGSANKALSDAKAYTDSTLINKADKNHNHDSLYDAKNSASNALSSAKTYTDGKVAKLISSAEVDTKINTHNVSGSAHNDIRTSLSNLTTRLNTLADSDDTTLDQLSEIVTYIKSNKSLIDSVTTSKVSVSDIINNLTTNVSNKPLSSAQGVTLKGLVYNLTTNKANASHTHSIANITNLQGTLDAKQPLESTTFTIHPSYVAVRTPNRTANQYYEFWDGVGWDNIAAGQFTSHSGGFVGDLTGNATSATTASSLSNMGTLTTSESVNNFIASNRLQYALFQLQSDIGVGFASHDGMLLSIPWNSTTYGAQIAIDDNTTNPKIAIRGKNTSWGNWKILPFSDGTNASGTWGINITGNAGSASKWATARTLTLTGAVTGSASIDGSGNVSLSTSNTHNHEGIHVKTTGDSMTGKLVLNTTIHDHAQPVDQALVINAGSGVPSGTTLSLKNAPGIGFHVGNVSWASMVFDGTFHFVNSAASGHVPIRAADIQGTTGTFSSNVSIGGNLTLDGKLGSYSISPRFYSASISTAGWYRVFTSANGNSTGKNGMILTIGRNYNSPQNEEYVFSINVGYNGDISITQLSGAMGGNLIKKIRVLWSNSGIFYIDFYTEYKNYTNGYYVYGIGEGTFCNPTATSIPSGWSSYEFTTTAGCKSNRGFVGDLAGNATTASSAVGVQDYNKNSRVIKIGYEGSSTTADQIKFIAAYISDTQIKDITKSTLQSWLGLGSAAYTASTNYATSGHTHSYLPLSGGTMSNGARISSGGGSLYLGNENNSGWVYTQDIASQSGTSNWAINISGNSWFKQVNIGYTYTSSGDGYALNVNGTIKSTTSVIAPTFTGNLTGNASSANGVKRTDANANALLTYTKANKDSYGWGIVMRDANNKHCYFYFSSTKDAEAPSMMVYGADGSTNSTILTSANYNTWAAAKSHTHSYLPLSGGTMTDSIIMPKDDSKGILPHTDNYGQIGSAEKKFYRMYASTFYGNLSGNATSATKATQDGSGNTITSTYATKTELSGKVADFNGEAYHLTIAGDSKIIYDIHMDNGVKFCAKSLNDKSTSLIYLSTGDNVLINHSAYTNRDVRNVYSYVPWNDSKAAAYGIYGVANGNQNSTNTLVKTGYNTSNVAYINIPPIYNGTTSDAANVFVSSAGKLSRSTSASKYKLNIAPINEEDIYPYNILKLNPKQWHDKASIERYSDLLTREVSGEVLDEDDLIEKDTINIDTRYGLIAEDVEAAGLDKYCSYELDIENNTKELEGIQYDRVATLLIPVVRDLVLYTQKTAKYIHVDEMSEDDCDEIANLLTRINSFKESEVIK